MIFQGEPDVVISGIGCRLPTSENFDDFSKKLISGENLISTKHKKWPKRYGDEYPDCCGDIDFTPDFDHSFFKVSSNLAASIDYLAKYILPSTFEALLDAGLTERDVNGSNSQVYAGSCLCESDVFWKNTVLDGYAIVGRNRGMLSNRVSFWLDTKGSSVSIDGSWVSGIQQIISAVNDLKAGRCDIAIVVTGNLLLTRNIYECFQNLGIISTDGVSRPYDEDGNGIIRCDAIVALILQKSTDAKRSYTTIVDGLCTHDGERDDLSKSSVRSWVRLFEEFYSKSHINPADIGFIEGNGFGIKEEDENELKAIEKFFCPTRNEPVIIGSVKSNMGHSEGSSALCSILKAIAIFKHQTIPPNLNYNKPIQSCDGILNGKIQIPQENITFPDGKLIAINALGLAGTYSHLVIAPPKTKQNVDEKSSEDEIPWLVLLSARKSDDISLLVDKINEFPYDPNYYRLVNMTLGNRREIYLGRGYTILNKDKAIAGSSDIFQGKKRQIWYVFTGMGSQWISMGRDLLKIPLLRRSLENSHNVLVPKGIDLLKILSSDEKTTFDNILHSFVGIAAIQIALVDLLNEIGIIPDYMIGHSVGELGCSYADGCLTAEQMILSAYYRGKASLESELITGMMAAIGKGYKDMKDILPADIEVACHNSKTSCTLSGPAESVNDFVKRLQSQKIFARAVNVSNIAYHSQYIRPAAPKLLEYLKELIPQPKQRSDKWISTSIPQSRWNEDLAKFCSPEYLTNNLLSSVLFEEGSDLIPPDALCIEIAPHGLLQSILRKSLHDGSVLLSLTNRSAKDNSIYLLEALGKIHIAGVEMDINRLYPPANYPVPLKTPGIAQLIYWARDKAEYFNKQDDDPQMVTVDELKGDVIENNWVFQKKTYLSPSTLLRAVWKNWLKLRNEFHSDVSICFEKLKFHIILPIERSDRVQINIRISSGSGHFEVTTDDEVVLLTGVLHEMESSFEEFNVKNDERLELCKENVYSELSRQGYEFNEFSKTLESVSMHPSTWIAKIKWTNEWTALLDSMFVLTLLKKCENTKSNLEFFEVRRLSISTSEHLENYKMNEVLEAKFDVAQDIVRCGEIEMIDVKWKKIPSEPRFLVITQPRFVPYIQPHFMNKRMFLDFVLHVVKMNKPIMKSNKDLIKASIISSGENGTTSEIIEDTLKDYDSKNLINVNVITTNNNVWPKTEEVDIILAEKETLSSATLCDQGLGFILLVLRQKLEEPLKRHALISNLSLSNSLHMYLLKRIPELNPNQPMIVDLSSSCFNLIKDKSVKKVPEEVLFVGRSEPDEGIVEYVKTVRRTNEFCHCRFLFILDENAPDFDLTHRFYSQEIEKGLVVNVYKNGTWGTFHYLTFDKIDVLEEKIDGVTRNGIIIENFSFDHDEDIRENEATVVFSGKQKKEKLMGVGVVQGNVVFPDETLTWRIPQTWTSEEAVNVARCYCLAYEAFEFNTSFYRIASSMIVGGYSPEGLAAISVALKYSKEVFVTVEDQKEEKAILEMFPQLSTNSIVYHSDDDFDINFLSKRKGKGVEMIYYALKSERIVKAAECAGSNCRIVLLDKKEIIKNNEIGMFMFMFNITMTAGSLKKIHKLRKESKIILKSLIQNALDDGTIQPIKNVLSQHTKSHLGYRQELFQNKGKQFKVEPDSSYIVVGDGTTQWLEVVEQLIKDGAEKMIVLYTGEEKQSLIKRRLICSTNETNSNIIVKHFSSDKEIYTENIIKSAENLGPLSAIFIVSRDGVLEDSKIPLELDKYWRNPSGYFICFVNNCSSLVHLCKLRFNSGHKTTAIQNPGNNFLATDVCRSLDNFVQLGPFSRVSHEAVDTSLTKLSPDFVLEDSLPSSSEKLQSLGSSLSSQVSLVKLQTLNTCTTTHETATLIFIPGLDDDPRNMLQSLSQILFYPAYFVNWSREKMTIDKMVFNISEAIKHELNDNPYINIVGLSLGNFIALKVCKLLEESNFKIRLFLVGYSPLMLDTALKSINTTVDEYLSSKYFEDIKVNEHADVPVSEYEENHKNGLTMVSNFLTELLKEDYENYKCKSAVLMLCNDFETDKKINKSTIEKFIPLDHKNLHLCEEFLNELHQHAIFSRSTNIDTIEEDFPIFLRKKKHAALCTCILVDQY